MKYLYEKLLHLSDYIFNYKWSLWMLLLVILALVGSLFMVAATGNDKKAVSI